MNVNVLSSVMSIILHLDNSWIHIPMSHVTNEGSERVQCNLTCLEAGFIKLYIELLLLHWHNNPINSRCIVRKRYGALWHFDVSTAIIIIIYSCHYIS